MIPSTVIINNNGFFVGQGVVNPEKALQNLAEIEKVLSSNIPTASKHESTIKELMQAAKENRDFLIKYIRTDTIFDRAWSHLRGKDKAVEDIYRRIQTLLPQYEQNYREAIANAKAMGWKGNDEDAPRFMIDFDRNLRALVEAKVIEEKDIVRTPNGKIKIPETMENIKKGKKENLIRVMDECLVARSANRLVQLGLFGLDFNYLLRHCMLIPDAQNCVGEVIKYIDDFSNHVGNFYEKELVLLTKLDKISITDPKQAMELFARICKFQDEKFARELLQKLHRGGVDFTDKTKFGQEPIFLAIKENSLIVFKYLVECGADVTSPTRKNAQSPLESLYKTSMFEAATKYDFLIELFKLKPQLAQSTEQYHGSYALRDAISDSKDNQAHELIRLGVNVNGKENDPIVWAIKRRNNVMVKALLDKGATVTLSSAKGGGTLIFDAVNHGNESAIKLIVNAGADIDAIDSKGDTALLYALRHNFNMNVIRELIQNGINVHAVDKNGNNALHLALRFVNAELIKTLLEAGVDPDQKNDEGKSPRDLVGQFPGLKPLFEKNLKKKMP